MVVQSSRRLIARCRPPNRPGRTYRLRPEVGDDQGTTVLLPVLLPNHQDSVFPPPHLSPHLSPLPSPTSLLPLPSLPPSLLLPPHTLPSLSSSCVCLRTVCQLLNATHLLYYLLFIVFSSAKSLSRLLPLFVFASALPPQVNSPVSQRPYKLSSCVDGFTAFGLCSFCLSSFSNVSAVIIF